MIVFSLMLFSAAIAAWIVSGDIRLRFAAMLYAALAVAAPLGLGGSVALIVLGLAPASIAFGRSVLALAAACILGLAAAATGITMIAVVPLLAASLAIALTRRNAQAVASALALVLGAGCFLAGSLPALMAFASTALLGLALQAGVEEQGGRGSRRTGIRTARPVR